MKKTKKFIALLIATITMASNIAPVFATDGVGGLTKSVSAEDKCPTVAGANIPARPVKPGEGETAESITKNPDQPNIYTLRKDYLVERGVDDKGDPKYVVNYQPYKASVGEAATDDEKAKVNKTINLPDLSGYNKPTDSYQISYDIIKNAAENQTETGNEKDGFRYEGKQEFNYPGRSNKFRVKHIFQKLEDFCKYTNPDGTITSPDGTLIDADGNESKVDESEIKKHEKVTTKDGNTGSKTRVEPLIEGERKGFVPEKYYIEMQVPDNATDFVLEYRYNRAHFNVNFNTDGGTSIPSRTIYYEQEIPKIDANSITKKEGSTFLGWKPSVEIKKKDGGTIKPSDLITEAELTDGLIMPAEDVTFTAQWKDESKADYAIQFWTEKADHADGASLLEKYDYMGTRVYKNADAGYKPDLDKEPVKGLKFPDLDQNRLDKIWKGDKFNFNKHLYLNKFYVYNKDLTDKENSNPQNPNVIKSVSPTGQTVYNIYYDRQVYDLYFTESNYFKKERQENTFYPEIWGYDESKGKAVMKGGPGNPYHYKARFNEMMYKWPNDAKQTKGFTPGYQSFGWGPNYANPNWPLHLDTPPYRLNADEFLDMDNYDRWGGYTKKIDKGDGTTIDLDRFDFTTLSFGIKQYHPSIPHHMDFWMDGFKDGETIIRYDLVRTKADTDALDYGHRYPIVTGFTPYGYNPKAAWPAIKEGSEEDGRVDEDRIGELNDERDEITPNTSGTYYNNNGIKLPIGQLDFIPVFYSDSDEFGNVKEGGQAFEQNGYLRFKYKRNKYPLRFNYDPSKIKGDNEFDNTNSLDTFYEFPLKVLSPDLVDSKLERKDKEYFKEDPKNFLDNPKNLQKLGLTDLVEEDKNGKLRVKRPQGLSDQMVFKGWALDPDGKKMVWENPGKKMPDHPVNLYAIWGELDYKWKVTFDPDGGKLDSIDEANITTERKKIKEGDIGDEKEITYAKKGDDEGDKQIFTVVQRQKLVEPQKPKKKGYDFLGWEVIRYKKGDDGNYTNEQDKSYREKYGVPELYSFGTDVVAPIYLKAIWVPNQRVDVEVKHYFLDKEYNLDNNIKKNPLEEKLENVRANYMASTTGDKQDADYILATHDELDKNLQGELRTTYEEYNKRVKNLNNSYFQTLRVEPKEILDPESGKMEENPDFKNNVFKFFYRPFRKREYKVNYLDERAKEKLKAASSEAEKKAIIEKYSIIKQEPVNNGNRHYDARNYKKIPGWVLAKGEKPQQQLFFDVDENTNEFKGINGTGSDEITFYYRDVRMIEVPGKETPPDGYVRVTFKAGENGKLEEGGKDKTVSYDVVKGLKFSNIPVPDTMEHNSDKTGVEIVPDKDYQFVGWERQEDQSKGLLGKDKGVCENYTYVAKFEKPQGKLTIKKVLENEHVEKQSMMTRTAVPDPLKFKFKVTGPKINGSKNNEPTEYTEEFELVAGETKVLENLFDGDYKVEEIENHGYTPYYIEGDYNKTSSKLSADPIKVKLEKTDNKKDYEKTLTVVNKNVKPGEAETPNKNIIDITVKKVWDGGKKPDTTIELWRKGYKAEYKEDLTDEEKSKALIDKKVGEFTTTPGGDNEQSQTFKDLPKHDPSGREFEYYVKEENVPKNYTKNITGSIDEGFTVTNTYQKIDVEANKVWEGDLKEGETRPTIYFKLYRKIKDGEEIEVKDQEVKKLENSITRVNWKDLDRFDGNGKEFIYSVKEVKENGDDFTPEGYTKKEDGLTVTNTKDPASDPTPDPSVPEDPQSPKESKISISKQNFAGQEIKGAQIEIKTEQGETAKGKFKDSDKEQELKWTSGDEAKEITLKEGKYKFVEVAAPKGYVKVTEIEFSVDSTGKITVTNPTDSKNVKAEESKLTIIDDIEVGTLSTTVSVGEKSANKNQALEVKAKEKEVVKDIVHYENLQPGQKYKITGKLKDVTDYKDGSKIEDLKTVAASEKTFTVSDEGKGTVEVEFKDVQLEAGKKYVVFEVAESENNLKKDDKDGLTKNIIRHEDPKDQAQTIIVEPKNNNNNNNNNGNNSNNNNNNNSNNNNNNGNNNNNSNNNNNNKDGNKNKVPKTNVQATSSLFSLLTLALSAVSFKKRRK